VKKFLREEIEEYVDDWHWDEQSEKYAFEMGKFLFSFMDYLGGEALSARTKKNHRDNIYLIGMFEAGYGYNEEFYPENLEDGPSYLYEFERKVSDSKYALQSYESTWRKLDKYIKSGDYERYLNRVQEKIENE
jgi:hypothetical protein